MLESYPLRKRRLHAILRPLTVPFDMAQDIPHDYTDETTSHSANPPKNGGEAADYQDRVCTPDSLRR